ncbi:hypothetical protein EHQ43_17430 [Leptospira bouyouniensis]|uniref:Uncharacterized protein n=1 Tax=Leptospira bouyouniensis TaxID=2484911 RepID=A0A7I0IKJ4_9LEPT|nr:hypothetical protein [Leptospira bouyouniensis]TGL03538.1 hypothetical protein EHQ43_17430 [Leptospira bouyouniensis]
MGTKQDFRFNISDFREILREQEGRCYVTGRELTGSNCDAELKIPLTQNGKVEKENVCLILDSIRELKRYHTLEEIVEIARDIIKLHG